jgi:hypothetical protein
LLTYFQEKHTLPQFKKKPESVLEGYRKLLPLQQQKEVKVIEHDDGKEYLK